MATTADPSGLHARLSHGRGQNGRVRPGLATLAVLLLLAAGGSHPTQRAEAAGATCFQPRLGSGYVNEVMRALRAGQDVWGKALLARPDGPTYEGARRYLKPLLLARAAGKTALTESGVYYLPFAMPTDSRGAGSVALHVADGSQVVSERVGGRALTVVTGSERYGSCLSRLAPVRLAGGWLPILQTRYTDAAGARYAQESFATRRGGSLVSFLKVEIDAGRAPARLRFLARGGALASIVPRGETRTVHVAWRNYGGDARPVRVDEAAYDDARRSVETFWSRRLQEGAAITVPEERVNNAVRSLLVQNLALTWRYSVGNAYEQFSFPEGADVAQVMGELGFGDVAASILRTSLTRKPAPYPNWKMGEKLLGHAWHHRLFHDPALVRRATPTLRRYVAELGRQLEPRGLLGRERYSSDIPDQVYGLHGQAVVWHGLRTMAEVWAATGSVELGRTARRLAARLEAGLRRAVRASQRRLADGSLFVPVRLLDDEQPYESLTESRPGSYWNLVMPYALASGIFPPRGPQARGVLGYMLRHGSRLLGLVRAGAYALYRDPAHPVSGTDQVYGINVARFLADNDEADQLALSLYGSLAAGMTENTFVSGEAASVAPLLDGFHRAMYLPPNGASNAAFLETLRSMLVHERLGRNGVATGLELAFATPRPWLRPGKSIAVERLPTSFGPVAFRLEARASAVHATVDVPSRARPRSLRLRVRLPRGHRVTNVTVDGRRLDRVDVASGTIDLSGRSGRLQVVVGVARP
jgi:hypothetical protein